MSETPVTGFAVVDSIPERTVNRAKRPNTFAQLLTAAGVEFPLPEGKSIRGQIPYATEDDKTRAETLKRDAQALGRENNVTVRVAKFTDSGTGVTDFVAWCVKRQTRPGSGPKKNEDKPAEDTTKSAKK